MELKLVDGDTGGCSLRMDRNRRGSCFCVTHQGDVRNRKPISSKDQSSSTRRKVTYVYILETSNCLNGPSLDIGKKEYFSVYNYLLCIRGGRTTGCNYFPPQQVLIYR